MSLFRNSLLIGSVLTGCAADPALDTSWHARQACETVALLELLNDVSTDVSVLKDAGVHSRAARNIVAARDGSDGLAGTADDELFDSMEAVDDVSWVGPAALSQLYAIVEGTCEDDPSAVPCDVQAVLDWVNDPATTADDLKSVGVYSRGATRLMQVRAGSDGIAGTADDVVFDTLESIDDVSYIGASSMAALEAWGARRCLGTVDVIFSPQYYSASHLAETARRLEQAENTIDLAMYSFSDEGMYDALEAAADRGVSIRVIFHTANADRSDAEGSRSARIEDMGVEVRWVNKTMHHKYALLDGPRDDLAALSTATLITGSGNWSYGAASKYDENTVFVEGDDKLILAFQQEFNLMWTHSRPFEWNEDIESIPNGVEITDAMVDDALGTEAYFTSSNFRTYNSSLYGPTFASISGEHNVADRVAELIEGANDSIRIASGHMRSKQIAEALIAKRAADPDVSIQVYLDGQEYISRWGQADQLDDLEDCLDDATTETQRNRCLEVGYYWSLDLVDAGIDLQYDYYAYRWNYRYAEQMHHKYVIVDDARVLTGSYNFSSNAEVDSFENTVVFEAERYPELVDAFVDNFETLWVTGQAEGLYDDLMDEIVYGDDDFSIVWEPMALVWDEVDALKDAVWENCPDLNTSEYREEPWLHQTCSRDAVY